MQEYSIIHLRVPGALKGAWVAASRAQGKKLGDWIIKRVEMSTDFDGFTINAPAFLPLERYVLSIPDDEALAAFIQGLANLEIRRQEAEHQGVKDS